MASFLCAVVFWLYCTWMWCQCITCYALQARVADSSAAYQCRKLYWYDKGVSSSYWSFLFISIPEAGSWSWYAGRIMLWYLVSWCFEPSQPDYIRVDAQTHMHAHTHVHMHSQIHTLTHFYIWGQNAVKDRISYFTDSAAPYSSTMIASFCTE